MNFSHFFDDQPNFSNGREMHLQTSHLFDEFPLLIAPLVRRGTPRDDILLGRLGNDLLRGLSGNDLLLGLGGDDTLKGGQGYDLLLGGSGNDLLEGGTGRNILQGGASADSFILDRTDSFDLILDFQIGEDQFILQDGLTFAQLALQQQASDTLVRYLGSSEPAALLRNIQANQLTTENFLSTSFTPTFENLFVFGDSLSDPGNLLGLTGGFFPPPPYSEGRFSDGDIWIDFFAEDLAINPLSQISNFAVGGALTGRDNVGQPLLQDLTGQAFELPGLLDEVDQFTNSLGGEEADADGLYVIWAGSNDILNLPSDAQSVPALITNAIENIITSVTTLAEEGADTFLIPNLPDLGLTPGNLNTDSSAIATSASEAFNDGLDDALTFLVQEAVTDIDIVTVDIFSLTQEIISSPDEFGFNNVTDPLIEQGLPDNPEFFWWDQQHPTAEIYSLLSDVFQSALFEAGYLLENDEVEPQIGNALAAEDTHINELRLGQASQNVLPPLVSGALDDPLIDSPNVLNADYAHNTMGLASEPSFT